MINLFEREAHEFPLAVQADEIGRKGKKRGRRGPIFKRFLISLAKLAVKPSDVAVNRKKLKDN